MPKISLTNCLKVAAVLIPYTVLIVGITIYSMLKY